MFRSNNIKSSKTMYQNLQGHGKSTKKKVEINVEKMFSTRLDRLNEDLGTAIYHANKARKSIDKINALRKNGRNAEASLIESEVKKSLAALLRAVEKLPNDVVKATKRFESNGFN